MSKFKEGDRVVLVSDIRNYTITKVGWTGTYLQVDGWGDASVVWDAYGRDPLDVDVGDIEHDYVYNSPLYKALT
jgi:hypothetical protein